MSKLEGIIKLPNIQEFYDWCNEQEIPENIMYKIAGWLGSEVYLNIAITEQKLLELMLECVGEDLPEDTTEDGHYPDTIYATNKTKQQVRTNIYKAFGVDKD